jgi:hypothetical protein
VCLSGGDARVNELNRPKTPEDWMHRIWDAMDAFSPGLPLDDVNLLAGRKNS